MFTTQAASFMAFFLLSVATYITSLFQTLDYSQLLIFMTY